MSEEKRVLTTEQAAYRLGMSRATFYSRLKQFPDIKPINYNPNLSRQPNPEWRLEDLEKIGKPIHPEVIGRIVSD